VLFTVPLKRYGLYAKYDVFPTLNFTISRPVTGAVIYSVIVISCDVIDCH